ncbi:MAG: serpin family protein [Pirellulaceae bacterium]
MCFSHPASITAVLAMTLDGAEGQTRQEMLRVSHGHDDGAAWLAGMGSLSMMLNAQGDGYTLQMANRLWGEQDFRFSPHLLATHRANV